MDLLLEVNGGSCFQPLTPLKSTLYIDSIECVVSYVLFMMGLIRLESLLYRYISLYTSISAHVGENLARTTLLYEHQQHELTNC